MKGNWTQREILHKLSSYTKQINKLVIFEPNLSTCSVEAEVSRSRKHENIRKFLSNFDKKINFTRENNLGVNLCRLKESRRDYNFSKFFQMTTEELCILQTFSCYYTILKNPTKLTNSETFLLFGPC